VLPPVRVKNETRRWPDRYLDAYVRDLADGVRGGGDRLEGTRDGWLGANVRQGVRLGVDVGTVRIGVARSDPGGLLASPLDTVRRGSGDLAEVARLVTENEAIEVVVGLAVGLAGREGSSAADGREFASALAARLATVPVRLVDERFTTVLAHAALQQRGLDSRARRQAVDKAAAALVLQGALDAERSTGEPAGQLVAGGARS
jgi:putative holliday junction resolvase